MTKSEEKKTNKVLITNSKAYFQRLIRYFIEMSAEIESKNETPISNLQASAAELEIPRFYNSLMVVKMPNFEKNLKCLGWGRK